MVKIRPFDESDRNAIRQLCCDVADRGEAIENIFFDREIAADLLTSYYTDYEPQSSFIAEVDGKVVAYINGCLDNRRYGLAVLFLIIPKLIIKGLIRGVFLRRELWQILKAMLRNWRRILVWRKQSFHSHQGHLHIGVAKVFRGQQLGEQLMNTLLSYVKGRNIDEITASANDDNVAACHFFEHLGFIANNRYSMIMAHGNSFKEYGSISYVKKII